MLQIPNKLNVSLRGPTESPWGVPERPWGVDGDLLSFWGVGDPGGRFARSLGSLGTKVGPKGGCKNQSKEVRRQTIQLLGGRPAAGGWPGSSAAPGDSRSVGPFR